MLKKNSCNRKNIFLGFIKTCKKEINYILKNAGMSQDGSSVFKNKVEDIFAAVFKECEQFERENESDPIKVQKMRKFFIARFRDYFRLGKYNRMVIDKPYGYRGDFMIIDEIYKNCPSTTGVEMLLDTYFLNTAASVATRNRKEDFIKFLNEYTCELFKSGVKKINILDLASGPCRDLKEFLELVDVPVDCINVTCLDHDPRAIEYGEAVLGPKLMRSVTFVQKNILRIALAKNVKSQLKDRYHIIYSTGLFDYLNEKIASSLIKNLKEALTPNGLLMISNYTDKWANPSRFFMEWGGDWDLVYRTKESFLDLFVKANFPKEKLALKFEDQKIMQYCFATNNND